jgi:hypothetical protein
VHLLWGQGHHLYISRCQKKKAVGEGIPPPFMLLLQFSHIYIRYTFYFHSIRVPPPGRPICPLLIIAPIRTRHSIPFVPGTKKFLVALTELWHKATRARPKLVGESFRATCQGQRALYIQPFKVQYLLYETSNLQLKKLCVWPKQRICRFCMTLRLVDFTYVNFKTYINNTCKCSYIRDMVSDSSNQTSPDNKKEFN